MMPPRSDEASMLGLRQGLRGTDPVWILSCAVLVTWGLGVAFEGGKKEQKEKENAEAAVSCFQAQVKNVEETRVGYIAR
ncbi:hypothetical protein LZ32DRAFT_254542 [Colletotrichum eremochloae]|nr:hypothetical protein LZ32DRAFT_254542 [Colletotrichum eremochloae]